MVFRDYRPQSYKRIARGQRIQRQLREQAEAQAKQDQQVQSEVLSSEQVTVSKTNEQPTALAKGIFQGSVSVEDVKRGRVVSAKDVRVSGSVAQKLSRESNRPMSIREDINYQVTGKNIKDRTYQPVSKSKEFKKNGSVNNNIGNNVLGVSSDRNIGKVEQEEKVPKFYESQVKFLTSWEKKAKERSERLSDFGEKVITSSPFRKSNKPLGFVEQVGAKGLTSPAKILIEYPEQTFITAVKAGVFSQGLLFKSTRQNVIEEGKSAGVQFFPSVKQGFDVGTPTGVVNIATSIAAPSFVKKTVDVPKSSFVKAGSKYVPPEEVFSSKVLSGKENLPTVGSIQESVSAFKATRDSSGKIYAQTSSPAKLSGTKAGVGKKASLGLEDPGVYVTPKGQGSPYFLRVDGGDSVSYSFSVNPLKGLGGRPTVTIFAAEDVVTLPRSVIKEPGFKAVESFQESSLAGSGVVQITKRSELGQGSVRRQSFVSPGGKLVKEAGTSELEAVIPKGQEFVYKPTSFVGRLKGFDKYTTFKGQPVAIREAELVVGKTRPAGGVFVSRNKISSESGSLSSLSESKVSVRVPGLLNGKSSVQDNGSVLVSSRVPVSSLSGSVGVSKVGSVVGRGKSVGYSVRPGVVSRGGVSRGKSSVSVGGVVSSDFVSSPSSSVLASSGSSVVSGGVASSVGYGVKTSYRYNPLNNFKQGSSDKGKPFGVPKTESNSFSVELRRQGKFKSIGKGLTKESAIRLGERAARGSAGRTFRITSGKTVVQVKAGKGFYTKGGSVIENVQGAIDTPGELREITYKGVSASKRKRIGSVF